MENRDILDNDYQSDFRLNSEIRGYLKTTSGWAKFLAILGFIFVALFTFSAFAMFFFAAVADDQTEGMGVPFILIAVIYLVLSGLYLLPVLYLFRFANGIKTALSGDDERALTNAFANLKSHYKFIGISTIVVIGLYIIAIVAITLMPALVSFAG